MSNLSAVAKREMAKEKARLSGKRVTTPTPLETAADRWEEEEKRRERQRRADELRKESEETSFETLSPEDFTEAAPSKASDGFDWRPFQEAIAEKLEPRYLNTATIYSIGRKLIAREWRRALGKPKRNIKLEQLEREAIALHERSEAVREKEDQEKQRTEHHIHDLNKVLEEFASRLTEEIDEIESDQFAKTFEDYLRGVGNPYKVEWSEEGCQILYEPWAETRARKVTDDPVVYTAFIDKEMNITLLTRKSEDDNVMDEVKEGNLSDVLERLVEEQSPSDEDEIARLVQKTISEVGRIVSFNQTPSGWVANVEPWASMRRRNIHKEGEGVATLTHVAVDVTDGEVKFQIGRQ